MARIARYDPRWWIGTLVVALAVSCSSGGGEASPTVRATAEATTPPRSTPSLVPAQTPAPGLTFGDVEPITLRAGDPVPLPDALALYALDASYEGPSAALRRYYRDADGTMRVDDLVVSQHGETDDESRAVVGVVAGPGANDLAVALCHGTCYSESQPATIAHSTDGGITWSEVGILDQGGWGSLVAVQGDRVYAWDFREPGSPDAVYPMDDPGAALPVLVPATVDAGIITGYSGGELILAALGDDQRTIWKLDAPGTALTRIPSSTGVTIEPWDIRLVELNENLELQMRWSAPSAGGSERVQYLGLLDVARGKFRAVYRTSSLDGLGGMTVTAWLTPTLGIGRAGFFVADYGIEAPPDYESGAPALINLEAGTVSPIAEFTHFPGKAGGPVPVAVAEGPFARVAGTGDCLNVRSAPGTDAPVLACYRDGVLLVRGTETETLDGVSWLAVKTLDGRDGWAASSFLEMAR